jgi:hypothetical protein
MRTSCRDWIFRVVCGLGICLVGTTVRAEESAIQALQYYFDLLASENFESASMLWTPEAQERSNRFGISYPGVSLRVDATSPVVRNLPTMRYHVTPAAKQAISLADNGRFMQLEYSSIVNDKLVRWPYFAVKSGGYYSLTYAQDFYAAEWPVTESKYFRIHAHPDKGVYLNPAVLEEADNFVERMCDSLKIDKNTRSTIAQSKIEFFFCNSDSTVNVITGYHTKGLLDLASNDIISADFPHFHEVMHLLVNISLKDIPLQTLPLMREGYAVQQAGRWGKRASALLDLGVYLYKEGLVDLDSILTIDGFEASGGADIAYPVAGLVTSYLIEKMGPVQFWALYRECSFTDYTLDTLGSLEVRRRLVKATGAADWPAVKTDFAAYLDRISDHLAVAKAGGIEGAKELASGDYFAITQTKDWICFDLSSDTGLVQGNLLLLKDPRLVGGRSHLFEEQYGVTQPFEGYRFGVRFDQNEAGLYDYATNELVAKYIWGITPSDEYFTKSERSVKIRFKAELLKDALSKKQPCHLLPI